jgi:hypothetical protein
MKEEGIFEEENCDEENDNFDFEGIEIKDFEKIIQIQKKFQQKPILRKIDLKEFEYKEETEEEEEEENENKKDLEDSNEDEKEEEEKNEQVKIEDSKKFIRLQKSNWKRYNFHLYKNNLYAIGRFGFYMITINENEIKYQRISKTHWYDYSLSTVNDKLLGKIIIKPAIGPFGIFEMTENGEFEKLTKSRWKNNNGKTNRKESPQLQYITFNGKLYAFSSNIYEIEENGKYKKFKTKTQTWKNYSPFIYQNNLYLLGSKGLFLIDLKEKKFKRINNSKFSNYRTIVFDNEIYAIGKRIYHISIDENGQMKYKKIINSIFTNYTPFVFENKLYCYGRLGIYKININ